MDALDMILPGFVVVMLVVFITPCLTREISQNDDDALRTYIHELLNEFAREIQLKHDADISNLKEKFEGEISELKLEMARKEEAYKSKFTMIEAELKDLQKRVKSSEMPIQDKHMTENSETNLKSKIAGDDMLSNISNKTLITKTTEHMSIATYQSTRQKRQKEIIDKDNARHRREVSESKVAFFATLTTTLKQMGVNQDIVFDNAVTNIGNAYSPHHGIFVAPVDGTYVFSTTLQSSNPAHQWAHFVVNGIVNAKLYMYNGDHTVSHTVVVYLRKGHDVSVQNTSQGSSIIGDRYSSFSGFLLYEADIASFIVG